ncbi:hypothetical protein E4630_16110 [Aeromonas hydrophila]|uniref:hypothetical protein n=1 Tax=Aeromonas hydrophila TaxID=644 RepID=UPI00107EB2EA|nr:hypothetical protein [Aeromonas hydrophila]QBX72247.1 hypothetical protein E4625_16330 [Aeromonas hydrophila]QBX76947.1 hypothetical protein E4630_16110 [Aeromonas hydrophila]
MGVSGLAEGFLAGFNTMDRYQRGQQEEARQERELGLRDAMVKQNQANSERDFSLRQAQFDNTLAQQKKADIRYEDETKYSRGRDKDDYELRRQEAQGLALLRQQKMDHDAYIFARDKKDREDSDWINDKIATINLTYDARKNGQPDPVEYTELLKDPRLQKGGSFYRYNFDRYSDGQHLQAGRKIVPQISGLMKDIDSGELSWGNEGGQRAIVQRINVPEIIDPLNTILEHEIKRGVGEVDINSGKKIADKTLTHVIPTEDGRGVMYGLKVTYTDGSSKDSVVTEGRNTLPGDPVKVSKWGDLIKTVYERSNMYQQLSGAGQNRETLKRVGQNLGLETTPDYKGLQTALAGLYKQEAKALADGGDPATVKAAFDEARENLPSVYGVNTGGVPSTAASGVNPELWGQSDPERQQFMREAEQGGWLGRYLESPEKMDGAFALWRQAVAKDKSAKQAAASAEKVRNMEGGRNQPHNYRAAEEAAVNAVIAPFANGQPVLNKAPDATAAYQAMSLAQARR